MSAALGPCDHDFCKRCRGMALDPSESDEDSRRRLHAAAEIHDRMEETGYARCSGCDFCDWDRSFCNCRGGSMRRLRAGEPQ